MGAHFFSENVKFFHYQAVVVFTYFYDFTCIDCNENCRKIFSLNFCFILHGVLQRICISFSLDAYSCLFIKKTFCYKNRNKEKKIFINWKNQKRVSVDLELPLGSIIFMLSVEFKVNSKTRRRLPAPNIR